MDQKIKKLIEKIAYDIKKRYGLTTPIDIKDFIKSIGGKISYKNCSFDEIKIKNKNDFEFILVKTNNDSINYNIRIASMLGSLFLHSNFLYDNVKTGNYPLVCEKEEEATVFAYEFLMPSHEYKKYFYDNVKKGITIDMIAEHFNVNKRAAINKGIELNILNPYECY